MIVFREGVNKFSDLFSKIFHEKNKNEEVEELVLNELILTRNIWDKVYLLVDYKNHNKEQLNSIEDKLRTVISNIGHHNNAAKIGELQIISKKSADGLNLKIVNNFGDDAEKFDHYVEIYDNISRETEGELKMEGRARSLKIILEYRL